jgi:hypothetical protein
LEDECRKKQKFQAGKINGSTAAQSETSQQRQKRLKDMGLSGGQAAYRLHAEHLLQERLQD